MIDSPADTLSEVDAKTLGNALANFVVVALVETQMATNGDVQGKILVDMLDETLT